jgi:hypothetical protein
MNFDELEVVTLTAISTVDSKTANHSSPSTALLSPWKAVKQGQDARIALTFSGIARPYQVRFGERSASLTACEPGPILVYCGGFTNCCRPYAASALKVLQNIGYPFAQCVVFKCGPDRSLRTFNFCQDPDMQCVSIVLRRLLLRRPDSQFILYGGCKGGSLFLKFIGDRRYQEEFGSHILSVIAESPPVSLRLALAETPCAAFTLYMLSLISRYPLRENDLIWSPDSVLPSNVRILVGSLPGDTISRVSDVRKVIEAIGSKDVLVRVEQKERQAAKVDTVQHFVSEVATLRHGRVGQDPKFVAAVRAFILRAVKA